MRKELKNMEGWKGVWSGREENGKEGVEKGGGLQFMGSDGFDPP